MLARKLQGAGGLVGAGGGGWVPTDSADLLEWWDASDVSSLNLSGSTVNSWSGQSTSSYTVSLAEGTPTYDSVNDRVFVSENDNLNVANNMGCASDPYLTVVAYIYCNNLVSGTGLNGGRWFGIGNRVSTGLRTAQCALGADGFSWRYNGGATQVSDSLSNGDAFIVAYTRIPNSTNEFFKNGTSLGSGTMTSTLNLYGNAELTAIGDPQFSSTLAATEVYDLAVFESASADDRQKAEGYMAHKWGLTANLPSGHPYKSSAP